MSDSDESSILTRMSYTGTPDSTSDYETSILPIVKLCLDADLTLLVGESPVHRFMVSRNTLCMASPVFRAMLTGRFIEAWKDEIQLEGDDPDAMLIVLRIAHLRFSEVKRFFRKPSELVSLAIICDKYDMVATCRPFIHDWMKKWLNKHDDNEEDRDENREYRIGQEGLWTAWVFGYTAMFTLHAFILASIISTDAEDKCIWARREVLNDQLMPLGFISK
jgi:hypothetical protein